MENINSVDDTLSGNNKLYKFNLYNNYPNPFNYYTTITFSLEESGNVKLELFDVLERRISILVNEHLEEGFHRIGLNASGLSSGVYYYKMKSGNFLATKKMIYLK